MSKRGASGFGLKMQQKQRKNGISSHTVVLDLADTPPSKPQVMRVWQMSTSDPSMSRVSVIPIPSGPKTEEPSTKFAEDSVDDLMPLAHPVRPRRVKSKRKFGNDSVSHGYSFIPIALSSDSSR